MLTLVFALLGMVVAWMGLHHGLGVGPGWSITLALLLGVGIHVGVMLLIRRRIGSLMADVQTRMTERNNGLKRKYQQLGSRGGNFKQLMDQASRDQAAILAEALEATRPMDVYCKWNLLLDRQINAIRVQFLYPMKKFEEVDRILPKTMLTEPLLCCMKMCRHYQRGQEDELRKTYNKYRKRFKHDSPLIYATYAWMLLRKKKTDEALKVLLDGKTATDDETLAANWEHVANNKAHLFSNAAFGEPWYALLLEEPKQPRQSTSRVMRPGSRPRWR
jgi:hypothetical protein